MLRGERPFASLCTWTDQARRAAPILPSPAGLVWRTPQPARSRYPMFSPVVSTLKWHRLYLRSSISRTFDRVVSASSILVSTSVEIRLLLYGSTCAPAHEPWKASSGIPQAGRDPERLPY